MRVERAKKIARKKQVSHLRRPEDLDLEAWQVALRKQFASEQKFKLKNIGGEPILPEFEVANPGTKRTYRVAIRGEGVGWRDRPG